MTVFRGCEGLVYADAVGGTPARVYEVRSYTYTESSPLNDASQIGDCAKKYKAGPVETTGTIVLWDDPTATSNQDDLTAGSDIDLEFYPQGLGSGKPKVFTPALGATISERTFAQANEENNGLTINFSVNGRLTTTSLV